jgi:hypothetical protein
MDLIFINFIFISSCKIEIYSQTLQGERMRSSSCKAKGRRFQQKVRDCLLSEFSEILQKDDVRSVSMGCSGDDVLLSPLAKVMLPFAFECKNVENPSVGATLRQAQARNDDNTLPVCVFGKNKVKLPDALTIIPHALFCRLFNEDQFQYDMTQHKLIPTITDLPNYLPTEYPQWNSEDTDAMHVCWKLKEHPPNTCNLWLQWEEMKKTSGKLPAAILIFSQLEELGPHVILPFGHFVRLVKHLWENSTARAHLLRLPPSLSFSPIPSLPSSPSISSKDCIVIDD